MAGGVEEIHGPAAGRGVDDDEVEAAVLVELVQLLYRHVLLRAGQRVAEVAVQPALQDGLGLGLVAGVPADRVVEGGFGVEHHRPQLPGPRSVHPARGVGQRIQAEGVGEAPGRIDGNNTGPPALAGAPDRDGCRSGGLTDSSRAAADDDPALLDEGEQVAHDDTPVLATAGPGTQFRADGRIGLVRLARPGGWRRRSSPVSRASAS